MLYQSRVRMLFGTLLKDDSVSHFNLLLSADRKNPMLYISSYSKDSFKSLHAAIANKINIKLKTNTQSIYTDVIVDNQDELVDEEVAPPSPPKQADTEPLGAISPSSSAADDGALIHISKKNGAESHVQDEFQPEPIEKQKTEVNKNYYLILSCENLKALITACGLPFIADEVYEALRNWKAIFTVDTSNIVLNDLTPYQVNLDDGVPQLDLPTFDKAYNRDVKNSITPVNHWGWGYKAVKSREANKEDDVKEEASKSATFTREKPAEDISATYKHATYDPKSRTARILRELLGENPPTKPVVSRTLSEQSLLKSKPNRPKVEEEQPQQQHVASPSGS